MLRKSVGYFNTPLGRILVVEEGVSIFLVEDLGNWRTCFNYTAIEGSKDLTKPFNSVYQAEEAIHEFMKRTRRNYSTNDTVFVQYL